MRTITVYRFDELNKQAKRTAIEKLKYVNVEDGLWAGSIYDFTNSIGVALNHYEYNNGYIEVLGGFRNTGICVAEAILISHFDKLRKLAKDFLANVDNLNIVLDRKTDANNTDTRYTALQKQFEKTVLEILREELQNTYKKLCSVKSIIRTARKMEFFEDGTPIKN
mgnify:CR=1 FL=1